MKSRDSAIRLRKFQLDERRRKVAQIEMMIGEFERMGTDLDREIRVEQDKSGIHDPSHFAYPTYAKAAKVRCENLKRSADELRTQLDEAKAAFDEALEEVKKVEALGERETVRDREELSREQAMISALDPMRMRTALA